VSTKYEGGHTGKCPHCCVVVRFEADSYRENSEWSVSRHFWPENHDQHPGYDQQLRVTAVKCPNCEEFVLAVEMTISDSDDGTVLRRDYRLVWPPSAIRPVPSEVPEHIAQDYAEAACVLAVSPKASAALSRRCLQAILEEEGGASPGDLADQIEFVRETLPTDLGDTLDNIRFAGNYAAHPKKSTNSGEILDVEPTEAECSLDILDLLFDYYYVRKARVRKVRAQQDARHAEAAKRNSDKH